MRDQEIMLVPIEFIETRHDVSFYVLLYFCTQEETRVSASWKLKINAFVIKIIVSISKESYEVFTTKFGLT